MDPFRLPGWKTAMSAIPEIVQSPCRPPGTGSVSLGARRRVEGRPAVNVANVISFDIEEHHRIEAAAGMTFSAEARTDYTARMEAATRRLLDQLAAAKVEATFYIVGEIARILPK